MPLGRIDVSGVAADQPATLTVRIPKDRHMSPNHTKIVMVIENIGSGGAQRQLCLLATSLCRLGFSIKVIIFRPDFFFEDTLRGHRIPIVYLKSHNRLHLMFLIRQEIRRTRPDVVIGYYHWANLFVVLSGLPRREFSVIVSERSIDISYGIKRRISYLFHRLADVVVSNSYTQGKIVERILNRSKTRTEVVINGVDTRYFRPNKDTVCDGASKLRLLVVARISPEKNVLRFIEAVRVVTLGYPKMEMEIDWYGHVPVFDARDDVKWGKAGNDQLVAYFRLVNENIERHGLEYCFRIHPAQKDVRELYLQSDVMCLPSVHEGCSNVIAEAMACGRPVLASRVGDNARLVEDGRNGFLFDPLSVEDIAGAIVRFSKLPVAERRAQGREGRRMAEELLSVDTLADRYVRLIGEVVGKKTSRN